MDKIYQEIAEQIRNNKEIPEDAVLWMGVDQAAEISIAGYKVEVRVVHEGETLPKPTKFFVNTFAGHKMDIDWDAPECLIRVASPDHSKVYAEFKDLPQILL